MRKPKTLSTVADQPKYVNPSRRPASQFRHICGAHCPDCPFRPQISPVEKFHLASREKFQSPLANRCSRQIDLTAILPPSSQRAPMQFSQRVPMSSSQLKLCDNHAPLLLGILGQTVTISTRNACDLPLSIINNQKFTN